MNLAEAFASGSLAVRVSAITPTEAIERVGELLVASGRTTAHYTAQMLQAIEEFGPYIVIAPGVALAHARPSEAVLSTGMALAVLSEGVNFGSPNDPVRLVFALAAKDHDGHIEVLAQLAEHLSDEEFVNSLLNASTADEIGRLLTGGSAE